MDRSRIYAMPPDIIKKTALDLIAHPKNYTLQEIIDIILIITQYEIGFDVAQRVCLHFIMNPIDELDNLPVIGVMHLARVYEQPFRKDLMDALKQIYQNPRDKFWGIVDECFDKFEIYLKIKKPQIKMIKTRKHQRG